MIVPGGFGDRGIGGMISAARYARETGMPYLGICLAADRRYRVREKRLRGSRTPTPGEFNANSSHKVIDFLPDQHDNIDKGGSLRLGAYPCHILKGSTMERCYGKQDISERHRHRYEFNNDYREVLSENGLCLCGSSPDGSIIEAVELSDKPFFVGVQFHPEFKSRPNKPHPLFLGLVEASLKGEKK